MAESMLPPAGLPSAPDRAEPPRRRRIGGRRPRTGLGRWLRRQLPIGLYARSLLIVIIPMVLLQSIVAFVFMERHWQLVTQRLSAAVTSDIAAVIKLIDTMPADQGAAIETIAREQLGLRISVENNGELPLPTRKPFFDIL